MSNFSLPYFTRLWMTLKLIARNEVDQGLYWAAFQGRLSTWLARNRLSQIHFNGAELTHLARICHTKDFLCIAESTLVGYVNCTNILAECLRRQEEGAFWEIADFATHSRFLACQRVLDIALDTQGETDEIWADNLLKTLVDKVKSQGTSFYGLTNQAFKHDSPDFLIWLWSKDLIHQRDAQHLWYYQASATTRDLFEQMVGQYSAHRHLDWTRQGHLLSTPGFLYRCVKST